MLISATVEPLLYVGGQKFLNDRCMTTNVFPPKLKGKLDDGMTILD